MIPSINCKKKFKFVVYSKFTVVLKQYGRQITYFGSLCEELETLPLAFLHAVANLRNKCLWIAK